MAARDAEHAFDAGFRSTLATRTRDGNSSLSIRSMASRSLPFAWREARPAGWRETTHGGFRRQRFRSGTGN